MPDDASPDGYGSILLGLGIVVLALAAMIGATMGGIAAITSIGEDALTRAATPRDLPVYWTVRRGETYSQIAERTGLSVEQLEGFNPGTNPTSIVPGQRLKLRLHVPPPPRKPKGPRFWTVRRGQTFSSISLKTGHSVIRLQELNPKLHAATLRPGDRVRLRR